VGLTVQGPSSLCDIGLIPGVKAAQINSNRGAVSFMKCVQQGFVHRIYTKKSRKELGGITHRVELRSSLFARALGAIPELAAGGLSSRPVSSANSKTAPASKWSEILKAKASYRGQNRNVTPPMQVSLTPINSASSVETMKMPMNAPIMSQDGNMFFPGTQCLKISIPVHRDSTKVCWRVALCLSLVSNSALYFVLRSITCAIRSRFAIGAAAFVGLQQRGYRRQSGSGHLETEFHCCFCDR
jgi:hypothetical protein